MGKMGNVFVYTCQREFQVEKRVREQTDYVVECVKNHLTGTMSQTWYDVQRGREVPKFINHAIITHPERIYPLYDTFEVVNSKARFDDLNRH